jgi:hypothetical protein
MARPLALFLVLIIAFVILDVRGARVDVLAPDAPERTT